MQNKRGYSINYRISQDIEYAAKIANEPDRTLLATKALGAADLAVEFGLITYKEWEEHIARIFDII